MEARAFVKTIQMSPRKMRVVANLVRGEKVEIALNHLAFMPKKAARIITKALQSATANAEDKSGGEVDASPLVADDKVFVGSHDGVLYALSLSDGLMEGTYAIGAEIRSSPALGHGLLVVGAADGAVYAFRGTGR